MSADTLRLLVVAGETSGDLHGSRLVLEMKRLNQRLEFFGLGGDEMAAAGVDLLEYVDNIAVMGFAEVVRRYPFIRTVFRRVVDALEKGNPARAILIDYPGFNLKLARELKNRSVPITYFISPQLWAWREKRIEVIRECVDQVLCIFPFEEVWYRQRGVEATFVGHPFLDLPEPERSKERFYEDHGLNEGSVMLAIMPGSRQQEVDRHLPVMIESANELRAKGLEIQPVLGKAPGISVARFDLSGVAVESEEPQLALRYANVGLVASGTASLEAALYGTPAVIIYKMSPITWWLVRRMAQVAHISMTNLVAGKEVLPELLQGDATPEEVVEKLKPMIVNSKIRNMVLGELGEVREKLGRRGAVKRAAKLIVDRLP